MLKLEVTLVILIFSSIYCSPIESIVAGDQSLNYRLPNDSLPLHYDLWISTDIHKSDFTFSGRVKIKIVIKEVTETITLHSRDITVDSVDLYDSSETLKKSKLQFDYVEELEFVKVKLQTEFAVGVEIYLDISYRGLLTDETNGFFKTYLINRNFQQEWIALTHFEPINARKAFVCYDEPQIKTPFKLQIRHDKSYQAISNMPINRIITDVTNYVTTVFEETPSMPTYVLAFVVSKLTYVSNNRVDFEQRVYGDPEKIENGTANFALTVVEEILDKFKEIFNMTTQISKLDHVAIPLINGATENYGLITYEETFLLINEAYDQLILDYFKPIIIEVIAHETSHQYFGNLVTHSWWSYLWLSEGFATFYQYYLPHLIYPQYDFMEKFRTEVLDYAFIIDDYSEIAMNDYVQTSFEIQNKFHPVSFEKAAAVIRMFCEAIGHDAFSEGIVDYLSDRKFKIATPNDLHKSLQLAFNRHNPGRQLDIGNAMSSWENQAGYPVVSVRKINSSIILQQQKFNDRNSKIVYSIPLSFTTQSNSAATQTIWMISQSMEIENILTNDEWIIFNVQQVGYYRMDYSRDLWYSIIKGYPSGMHRINRELLHEEMFIAYQTLKTMTMCDCMQLLSVLRHETEGAVWEKAEYIDKLNQFMLFSDVYPHFRGLLRDVLEPHMHILSATHTTLDTRLLNQVTKWSRVAQHHTYLLQEHDKLLKYMLTNDEQQKPDFCSAFRIANASIYNFYVEEMLSFDSFVDMELVFGIGCSLDAALLGDLFEKLLDPTYDIGYWMVMDILRTTIEASEVGLVAVMDFIAGQFIKIENLNEKFCENMLIFMHQFINSDDQLQKFKCLTQILVLHNISSSNLVNSLIASIESKLQESEWRELRICFGLEEEQTSSTYQTETTTLGGVLTSSSSIKIIAICISLSYLLWR